MQMTASCKDHRFPILEGARLSNHNLWNLGRRGTRGKQSKERTVPHVLKSTLRINNRFFLRYPGQMFRDSWVLRHVRSIILSKPYSEYIKWREGALVRPWPAKLAAAVVEQIRNFLASAITSAGAGRPEPCAFFADLHAYCLWLL